MCILELKKVLMYEFHYDYIKNKYDNKDPPPPPLLIFRFEETSLTLPPCYVENKKC